MGKKRRKTFSLDPDVVERIDNEFDNASERANQLFREFLKSGDVGEAAVAVRLELIAAEIEELEQQIEMRKSKIDRLRTERQELEAVKDDLTSSVDDAVNEAVERIEAGRWNRDYINPDNPVVKDLARQADVSPRQFIDELQAELNGGATA